MCVPLLLGECTPSGEAVLDVILCDTNCVVMCFVICEQARVSNHGKGY